MRSSFYATEKLRYADHTNSLPAQVIITKSYMKWIKAHMSKNKTERSARTKRSVYLFIFQSSLKEFIYSLDVFFGILFISCHVTNPVWQPNLKMFRICFMHLLTFKIRNRFI